MVVLTIPSQLLTIAGFAVFPSVPVTEQQIVSAVSVNRLLTTTYPENYCLAAHVSCLMPAGKRVRFWAKFLVTQCLQQEYHDRRAEILDRSSFS